MLLLKRCVLLLVLLGCKTLFAQQFVAVYNFASVNSSTGRTDNTAVPSAAGIEFSPFVAVAPTDNPNAMSVNPNASGRFSFTGWPRGATNNSNSFSGALSNTQYYEVVLTPNQFYSLKVDSIVFTIQRSGTGIRQYAVRSSLDGFANNLPATISRSNPNLQVVSNNIFEISDATTTAQTGSLVNLISTSAQTEPVRFRFYGWNAEAVAGTFSIDDVTVYGSTTLQQSAPVITLSSTYKQFPATAANNDSTYLNYTVQAKDISSPLQIKVDEPFKIAVDPNGPFSNSLTLQEGQVQQPTTVYVLFAPKVSGSFFGQIMHSSGSATEKLLSLYGQGIDPTNLNFSFDSCTISSAPGYGFTSYSLTGAQQWACTSFGMNSTGAIDVNGFSGSAQENEDWLISPPLQIANQALPVLSFWSRGAFTGPSLQLLVSTSYDGYSAPDTFTWDTLDVDLPLANNQWYFSDGIDLSKYKNATRVFVAFRYSSSIELGAARWTIDEVNITNRNKLVTAFPARVDFGEVVSGSNSNSIAIQLKVVGYEVLTLQAPTGYEVSGNNVQFSSSIVLTSLESKNDTTIYLRFSPQVKALKVEGKLSASSTGLDTTLIAITGTSYPKAETFDAGTYNLSFFGSNPTNNPTTQKIALQVNNIATILERLNLDIVGVQEVSNDTAFEQLVKRLPNRAGLLSNRWSVSYNPPDASFPDQKIGFIYDTTTCKLVEARPMFVGLYDSARGSFSSKLPNYPGGAASFWASGRLPYMATFDVKVDGFEQRVRVIVIHAKSATDVSSYNRRVYDVRVLQDSINVYYPNEKVFVLGDFNDRLFQSTYQGAESPYKPFLSANEYNALTLPLEEQGQRSFAGSGSMIDHIVVTHNLSDTHIPGSTQVEDPSTYISGYNGTSASDHYPVYARFAAESNPLPIVLLNFDAQLNNKKVLVQWTAMGSDENSNFVIERSGLHQDFKPLHIRASRTLAGVSIYTFEDVNPLPGTSFYRLQHRNKNGSSTYSKAVQINVASAKFISIYPNPVQPSTKLTSALSGTINARVIFADGKTLLLGSGVLHQIEGSLQKLLPKLNKGVYFLELYNNNGRERTSFIKQ